MKRIETCTLLVGTSTAPGVCVRNRLIGGVDAEFVGFGEAEVELGEIDGGVASKGGVVIEVMREGVAAPFGATDIRKVVAVAEQLQMVRVSIVVRAHIGRCTRP